MVNSDSFYMGINKGMANLQTSDTNLFQKQVIARVGNLLAIPLAAVYGIKDGIEGTISAVRSIVPYVGKSARVNDFSSEKLHSFGLILSRAYVNALGVINPNSFLYTKIGAHSNHRSSSPQPIIHHQPTFFADEHELCRPLFFTDRIANKIFNESKKLTTSKNSFVKRVVSRLCFAASAPIYAITRTADLALGLISAAFSIVALGNSKVANFYAARGLSFPLVVSDVVTCAQRILYPYDNVHSRW